jgi:hypothetical protein
MAFSRGHIRESIEQVDDKYWEALVRDHTDVYPESNPRPGDVCRGKLIWWVNTLGFADHPNLELVQNRVERLPPRAVSKPGQSGSATSAGDQCPRASDLAARIARRSAPGSSGDAEEVRLGWRFFEDNWTLPGVSRGECGVSTSAPRPARRGSGRMSGRHAGSMR